MFSKNYSDGSFPCHQAHRGGHVVLTGNDVEVAALLVAADARCAGSIRCVDGPLVAAGWLGDVRVSRDEVVVEEGSIRWGYFGGKSPVRLLGLTIQAFAEIMVDRGTHPPQRPQSERARRPRRASY